MTSGGRERPRRVATPATSLTPRTGFATKSFRSWPTFKIQSTSGDNSTNYFFLHQKAIQMWNAFWGHSNNTRYFKGECHSVTKCHKGDGGGKPRCHLTFSPIFKHIVVFWESKLKFQKDTKPLNAKSINYSSLLKTISFITIILYFSFHIKISRGGDVEGVIT